MTDIVNLMNSILTERMGMAPDRANALDEVLTAAGMIAIGVGLNYLLQSMFRWLSEHSGKLKHSKWHPYLIKRKIGHHLILLATGLIMYFLLYLAFARESGALKLMHRMDIIYTLVVIAMTGNSILLAFLDFYSTTDKHRSHPLQGLVQALQVVLFFITGIIIVAVLIDKSPTVLLTGLGASAAVLMLVFKDSILGFVAGIQLSQNNMVKLGDWIQMPDGSANGIVEEITLNTVKVRNWDNTITTIPPYTLISSPFKNWRGMQESGGRRADKCIYIDIRSLEIYHQENIVDLCKEIPLLEGYISRNPVKAEETLTNIRMFRLYIELYLQNHPDVNQRLDLIVTLKEATPYGLPIEVYFFIRNKEWAVFEKKQSDIFSHLMAVAPQFGLSLYQRP